MSLMDFSSIEKEIQDAPAPHILDKGTEAQIRIIKIGEGVSDKNNARWFMPYFDVPSDPMAKEFNTFFYNPLDNSKLDEKARQQNNFKLQQFFKCFGISDLKAFSFDNLVGSKGWAILGVQKDDEYGDKNTISKWIVPQAGQAAKVDSY